MIQALDLARENAALKDEVDRLRQELTELVQTSRPDEPSAFWMRDQEDTDQAESDGLPVACGSAGQGMGAVAPLMLIMPRYRASEYEVFAGRFASVPDCKVIVDRRVAERRYRQRGHADNERRRGDRRSAQLDTSGTVVLSVR